MHALHLSQPHQPREVRHTYLCIDGKLYSGKFHVLHWYVRYDGIQTVKTKHKETGQRMKLQLNMIKHFINPHYLFEDVSYLVKLLVNKFHACELFGILKLRRWRL